MPQQIGGSGSIVQLSLVEAQAKRLTTWLPEIVGKLRPGAPIQVSGDEIRIGAKGSLALYPDGGWADYEADHHGFGAVSLITHELAEQGVAAARRFALDWLQTHPGAGSFVPDQISEAAAKTRAERHARWVREILEKMQPIAGTDSEANVVSRGLTGPYPPGLLGHLPNARLGESALVALLTDATGIILGLQLGYFVPGGAKSALMPQRNIFWCTLDPEARKSGLFRIAPVPRTLGDADVLPDTTFVLPDTTFVLPDTTFVLPDTTLICEGAEKALACHMAFPFLPVLGAAGIGRLAKIPPVKGSVVIIRDGDEPNSRASKSLVRGVDHLLLTGTTTVRVTDTPLGADADSIVLHEGIEALRQLILAAVEVQLSAEGEAQRLAGIKGVLEYDEERGKAAKRLGVRKSSLDAAVRAQRRIAEEAAELPEEATALGPTPWSEPIGDIGAVLSTASNAIGKHVVASQAVRDVTSMWSLFTHFVHHELIEIWIAPRLEIRGASPQVGKTTLLELTMFLVHRPLSAASLTPALVYRAFDQFRPTLICDEIDAQLRSGRHPELVALLKASHNRCFAQVPRNVPLPNGQWEVQLFSAWGTYAYTTVGRINDEALESRAISITLQRAMPQELVPLTPLVDGTSPVLVECGRKLARWAQDQTALQHTAHIPAGISHRDQDNWRPLLRLADLVGGDWPQRVRQAAQIINGTTKAIGDVVPLLTDIREVFGDKDRMSTEDLVNAMLALPESSADWGMAYHGRPINVYYLRDRLKGLINPPMEERRWRLKGGPQVRGFLRRHFDDAFARYLPEAAGSELPEEAAKADNHNEQPTVPNGQDFSFSSPIGTPGLIRPSGTEADNPPNTKGYERPDGFNATGTQPADPAQPGDPAQRSGSETLRAASKTSHPARLNTNDINPIGAHVPDGRIKPGVPIGEEKENSDEKAANPQPEIEQTSAPPAGKTSKIWLPKGDWDAPKKGDG